MPHKVAPPVPAGVDADGAPRKLSAQEVTRARVDRADEVIGNVVLRSGFELGDTSLVSYFDIKDDDPAWTRWRVRLFDAADNTEQMSTELSRDELNVPCGAVREFCRTFGARDGWVLDPAKDYFITIAAVFDDREVVSDPSANAKPRATIVPPPIPAGQASGCGCGTALGMTEARQAMRGDGVNTATGAFVRVEQDLSMASIGVPFASARVYSSANSGVVGPFGPGWAWSYGMGVTATDEGAVVRADDGAEVLYRLEGGTYKRPAGVRSNLRKTETGWELVTIRQQVYAFDAQGRLTAVRSPRGIGVTLAHTSSGITITDASGRTVQVKFDDNDRIREIKLPDHRKTQYFYDNEGRLVEYKDARNGKWRYTYAGNLLTDVQDPQQHHVRLVRNEYGADNRVTRQLDALDNATKFEWNAEEQEAVTTDADGVIVRDGYRGNVLVYTRRGAGDTDNHRYDPSLNRNLVVDGKHNQHPAEFDLNGNKTAQAAPQGFGERTRYDERNNPIEFTDANGQVWKNEFNEFNELVTSTDAEKHTIRYAYDDRGLLVTQTDQRGKVTRYEYIPVGKPNSGLLAAVISPEGRRSEVRYDATGRQTATIDPRGTVRGADRDDFTTRVTYDEQDRVLAVLQPGKREPSRTRYDEVGRVESTVNPTGLAVRYSYLKNGRLERVSDQRRTTVITYTPAGRRASVRVDLDRYGPDAVTTYRYNVKGLLHEVTSPRGNIEDANAADFTTTYRYDGNDNLVRISRPYPGGQVVHKDFKVDELDRTTQSIDEFGRPSSFERRNTGEVARTTDTLGRTVSMDYDRNGRQTGITNADNNITRFTYDEAGNKTRAESATGGVTTWTYTDDGLLATATEPRGNVAGADPEQFTTHFEYDLAGNRTKVIDPLDHTTTSAFDATNRLTASTDARGNTTRYRYRDDDQIASVLGPDARDHDDATFYDYYSDGLLASVRDPLDHVTRFDYDRTGRLTKQIDPLDRRTELTYDVENNMTAALTQYEREHLSDEERAARTITDTYDIVSRRTQRALGAGGPVYTWGYDAKDRITSYGDPAGVREVTYDDEDQITKVVRREAERTETFSYGYDVRGNITSRQYPDGTTVGATYDADSRMSTLTLTGSGHTAAWSFGYDIAGNRTSTTLPNPVGLIEQRAYDNAGRLTGIGTSRVEGRAPPAGVQDPVSAFQLELDSVGNPTKVTTTRGGVSEAVAYAYDKADRVTAACYAAQTCNPHSPAAGRISYSYDLVGNRTSQKRTGTAGDDTTRYAYDDANQLTHRTVDSRHGDTTTRYSYDVNGNQTKAGKDTFEYNLDNTLAKATVGGQTTTYGYDATGLRLTGATEQATQRWSWDVVGTLPQIAVDTVTSTDGTAVERRAFAYGPDDEPLALLDSATGAHSYTHDWLGGVANMLNPAGEVEAGYDYDPFGNPRRGDTLPGKPTPSLENPLQYTGAYQDSSTGEGNYFLRARNYNPDTGRFTSTDPMAQPGPATSAYTYADNNPLAYTDPTGAMPAPGDSVSGTSVPPAENGSTVPEGPSPEELAKAQQLQNKSVLDVLLEAGGQILMEFLGINDLMNCLGGDLGACAMLIIGALPWGKIFKAKKIAEAIFRAGKAVVTFFQELKWAKAIISGAERAAEAAKAAAAAAAKAAAEKAAKARALAEQAARKAAAEAAARAKALAAKAKAATKKSPKGCHSFVAGTRVLLANGTSKPIEAVKPGDTVKVTDPKSGETKDRQVAHTYRTDDDKNYVDVTVRKADGQRNTISATNNHPFWSVTQGRWVDASDLRPGELLRTSTGTYIQISAVRQHRANQPTYDLTIDDIHTYYVLAGATPVLVHNTDPAQCELLFPGPNARDGVPVSTFGDVTSAERRAVQQEGDQFGCHSCESQVPRRPSGLWTPDHQPITSLVPEGTPQLLFPHCARCMSRQGNLATKLLTGASPQGWRPNAFGLVVPKALANSGWIRATSGLLIPG